MYKRLFKKLYAEEDQQIMEYGWVFVIVFFLVLFLSQALFIWIIGPIKATFLWILLIVWSLFATFYLLFGNSHLIYKRLREKMQFVLRSREKPEDKIALDDVPEVEVLSSKPRDEIEPPMAPHLAIKKLEQEAHDLGALISQEGIKHISEFRDNAEKVLRDVVERGKNMYPRFDGWIVLNKSQVVSLLSHSSESRVPFSAMAEEIEKEGTSELTEDVVQEELNHAPLGAEMAEGEPEIDTYKAKNTKVPSNLPTGKLQSKSGGATATFMGLLCDGDESALFNFIREMRQGEDKSIRTFVTDAILILDAVHEHRVDGTGYVDREVLEKCRCFSNEELEEIIAILIGSIDYRYKLPEIGMKLSLVRAVEYIKKHRSD